jgi:hypothetical protein
MRLIFCALLAAAPAAHAARPFVTDDARVVDKGGCQIETFYKRQHRFDESEFWFLPACNPWGVELALGGGRVHSGLAGDSRALTAQGKVMLRALETNGYGFALSAGISRVKPTGTAGSSNPYFNAIGSFSFLDDRVVLHANLGAIRDAEAKVSRGTWGVGAEVLLSAPRWYGLIESYGQRGDKPTLHTGLRYWIVPNRIQVDATTGLQHASPERRFHTVGLRILW